MLLYIPLLLCLNAVGGLHYLLNIINYFHGMDLINLCFTEMTCIDVDVGINMVVEGEEFLLKDVTLSKGGRWRRGGI